MTNCLFRKAGCNDDGLFGSRTIHFKVPGTKAKLDLLTVVFNRHSGHCQGTLAAGSVAQ